MLFSALVLSTVAVAVAAKPRSKKAPNIVWFLTDDQDQMLGASFPQLNETGPMPQTKALMAEMGATANNFYIHTPICCPSRSELLSGRYFHNIKAGPGDVGPACMHVNEAKVNNATFAKYLKEEAGYTVGMFGKYLNNVPNQVPPGFDAWLANGGGDYLSPEFSTFNVDGLPNGTWRGTSDNYTTAVVGNLSIHWINKVVAEDPTRPFFAYVAPKAAHEPFNPAPWYADHWDPSWPKHEPRPINWNCSAESRADHHGNIATQPMLTEPAAAVITGVFKDRWRTLMSVDDVIASVIGAVEKLGLADSTYFFYSSDHGFQLGEFNIPMDKRHVYEWDTKIHLLARGPGIKAGMVWNEPATQVDMAATWLGLAGLEQPATFDGKSLVPLLVSSDDETVSAPTIKHLKQLGGNVEKYRDGWRTSVFIEHYYVADNDKCVETCNQTLIAENSYPRVDSNCVDLISQPNQGCWGGNACTTNCYPTESTANNFIGLRSMTGSQFGNTLYAEFETGNQGPQDINFAKPDFHEYYELDHDPWEMDNKYGKASTDALHDELHKWFNCAGASCP